MDLWFSNQGMSVRKQGLFKLAVGIPLGVAWFLIQLRMESISEWLKFVIPGFPGVLALIGIIELVTGSPIGQLAHAWDTLKGWQRLVLGLLVAIAFSALIFGGVYVWLLRAA
jgi:hypothetical protein